MRVLGLLKADRESEAGVLPSRELMEKMGNFMEEVAKAGVLLATDGLQPSSKGAKVSFQNGKIQVIDGPFAETKELLAGYWLIEVPTKEDAIGWAKRVPFDRLPGSGRAPEIEIRQMFEVTDFPDAPAEVVAMEESFASGQAGRKR